MHVKSPNSIWIMERSERTNHHLTTATSKPRFLRRGFLSTKSYLFYEIKKCKHCYRIGTFLSERSNHHLMTTTPLNVSFVEFSKFDLFYGRKKMRRLFSEHFIWNVRTKSSSCDNNFMKSLPLSDFINQMICFAE